MKQLGLAPGRLALQHGVTSWDIDHKNSSVAFSIEQFNLVSTPFRNVTGKFQVYTGAIKAASEDFNDAKIDFSVIAGSVNTGNHKRDRHLRSSDFFNVQKFPVIEFRSTSVVKVSADEYVVEGILTMCGMCRKVVFDVAKRPVTNGLDSRAPKFTAIGKINRLDFGIRGTALSQIFISKEVTISLDLEFLNQQK
jgi:polyisoprenoid-binding protein YceI